MIFPFLVSVEPLDPTLEPPAASPVHVWTARAIPVLAVLAPALGGTTEMWSQALLLLAIGVLFLLEPPRRSLGVFPNALCAALLALALSAFLPAAWFPMPAWRETLVHQFAVALPWTRTAQPWLTFESTLLLIAGMAWSYYLLTCSWQRWERLMAMRIFCVGIPLLGLLALWHLWTQQRLPFWPAVGNSNINFGFFPNRNHTADVLMIGGILVAALAFVELHLSRKIATALFAGLTLLVTALTFTYSRAGILLFFVGTAAFALAVIPLAISKKPVSLMATAFLLIACGFVGFGGRTLERVQSDKAADFRGDFRMLVQSDAVALSKQAPWLGAGLGNFEPLFEISREKSIAQNRALHPESDWLWAAVELGWGGPLLLLCALGYWVRCCFPFEKGGRHAMRLAAMICGLAFAVHGLVDVSGHKLGAWFPAFFVMSMAVRRRHTGGPQGWVAPVFRGVGVLLLATGAVWFFSARGSELMATSMTLKRLNHYATAAAQRKNAEQVIAATTSALRLAPLDWRNYQTRAVSEVALAQDEAALRDFRVARFLQPHWLKSRLSEAAIWLNVQQGDDAKEVLSEIIQRFPKERTAIFQAIFAAGPAFPDQGAALRQWARDQPGYLIAYLTQANAPEFREIAQTILERDPGLEKLSPEEREIFLRQWREKGDPAALVAWLRTRPELQKTHWEFLAHYFAERKNAQKAYELVQQFGAKPALPTISREGNLAALEREFVTYPHDLARGLALHGAQLREKHLDDALRTLKKMQEDRNAPAYLWFIEAEFAAKAGEWERAWLAWQTYESKATR